MVFHKSLLFTDNDPKTGVVLRKTAGPSSNTLDILWNSTGQITAILPKALALFCPAKPAPFPSITAQPSELSFDNQSVWSSASSRTNSVLLWLSGGYKPLLSTKFPKDLRKCCPLDSISIPEIETFQISMNNFLSQGHPRIRQLITGEFESPLISFEDYIDFM